MVSLRLLGDVLVVRTPYDPDFVADLKTLPATDRSFDRVSKAWLVTPNHAQSVADMMLRHFNQLVSVPVVATGPAKSETRVLEVRYIGAAKDRGIRFFVISDGQPDDPAKALAIARKFKSRIDVIYVGPEGGPGSAFLSELAKAAGGQSVTAAGVADLAKNVQHLLGTRQA